MSRSQPEDEKIVCVSCGLANYPQAHFCVECGAPMSAHSVNDPFDTIKADGWAVRKSQETPRLIVLIGNWLLFSPAVIGIPTIAVLWLRFILWEGVRPDLIHQFMFYVLGPVVGGFWFYVSFVILRRTTNAYLLGRDRRKAGDASDDDDDSDDGSRFDDGDDDEEDE